MKAKTAHLAVHNAAWRLRPPPWAPTPGLPHRASEAQPGSAF